MDTPRRGEGRMNYRRLSGFAAVVMALALDGLAGARAADPVVERGKYLVTIASCFDCHTPGYFLGKPDMTRQLAGSDVGFEIPGLGVFYGPNLTPDKETGLGGWTDAQIAAAITSGTLPSGRQLVPIMPWRAFARLTKPDVSAIIAYLKSLPPVRNKVPGPRIRRVGIDYHVDIDHHYYSVPYRFARQAVEVRVAGRTIEVFAKGQRIAAHLRSSGNGKHTTVHEHMPSSHRRYADWTIDRIRRDAAAIGPASAALCELILDQRSHPEQGFRACLGIIRLVKAFGAQRVEAAATRALDIGARTYGSVKSILDNNLDRHAAQQRAADGVTILHPNIRGSRYYH